MLSYTNQYVAPHKGPAEKAMGENFKEIMEKKITEFEEAKMMMMKTMKKKFEFFKIEETAKAESQAESVEEMTKNSFFTAMYVLDKIMGDSFPPTTETKATMMMLMAEIGEMVAIAIEAFATAAAVDTKKVRRSCRSSAAIAKKVAAATAAAAAATAKKKSKEMLVKAERMGYMKVKVPQFIDIC